MPKLSKVFVYKVSKMPRMPVTQVPDFFLIFYKLYQEILFIGCLYLLYDKCLISAAHAVLQSF